MTVPRRRVVVATLDSLGDRMAGPAIRAWELSSALAAQHDVRLVTFGGCERTSDLFSVERVDVHSFRGAVDETDVLVVQGYLGAAFPWLDQSDVVLVADMYDPFHVESLEVQRHDPLPRRQEALAAALRELDAQVRRADVFLCASPRQRHLWLGHLAAAGRVNPLVYDADPTLTDLVRMVPFGISPEPPVRRRAALKGVLPGIGPDDKVVLWGGGVYNWFDPLTLVHAVDRLRVQVPEVRLVFLGMAHPNPDVPRMRMAVRTRELADELGLTGVHVFFNESWVPYDERGDYLLDADVGVSCHFPGLETEFSFRTRILDYLWAGLPIVSTEGDFFADLVAARGLGRVVPAEDVDALTEALRVMLTDADAAAQARDAVRSVAQELTWPVVLQPVLDVCADPRRAADAALVAQRAAQGPAGTPARLSASPSSDLRAALRVLRSGGPRAVWSRVTMRLARLRSR